MTVPMKHTKDRPTVCLNSYQVVSSLQHKQFLPIYSTPESFNTRDTMFVCTFLPLFLKSLNTLFPPVVY